MKTDLEKRIEEALKDPRNLGELEGADAVGTVGNASCGEMLRLWIKFKEDRGKKIIDQATFQSFGCETAIAVASLATELIRGKTAEEALALSGEELAGELGPLPPMKIHCAQLVEGALQAALKPESPGPEGGSCVSSPHGQEGDSNRKPSTGAASAAPSLLETFTRSHEGEVKIVFLPPEPKE
jgi:nitrogen fixation protein NifU and related proteins